MAQKYKSLIDRAKTTANALLNGFINKASFVSDVNNDKENFLRESLRNELDKIEKNTFGNPWVYGGCQKLNDDQLVVHIQLFLDDVNREYPNTDPDEIIFQFLTRYYLLFNLKEEVSGVLNTDFTFENIFVDAKHAKSVVDILKEYNYVDDCGSWTGESGKAVELRNLYLAVKLSGLLRSTVREEKFRIIAFCKGLGKTVAESVNNKNVYATIRSIQPDGDKIPGRFKTILIMQTKFKELAKQLPQIK